MSKRVYLRSLELADIQRVHQWHNDPELYSNLTTPFHPVSLQTVEQWVIRKSQYSDKEINFAICLSGSSEHIGNIYLKSIDYINRNAFLGAFIGNSENRGKGYATDALLLVKEYASQTLGLRRLCMYVLANNEAAIKHLQKCDFEIEGKLRQHTYKNGTFEDLLIMGLCL